jgi:peptidoglycan/LPS O-acetylase OafA/YrhL
MNATNEIRPLTGVRGLAAVYVVLYHYLIPIQNVNALSTFAGHGYLAVDLFFALSGFVMAMTYGRMFAQRWTLAVHLKFLGRRVARIYPLYLVGTLIGLYEALRHEPFTQKVALQVALNITMVQAWGFMDSFDGPCWSISAEWAAYLVFPLLLWPTLFGGRILRVVSVVGCSLVLGALCLLPASFHGYHKADSMLDLVTPAYAIPVIRCLAEFMLGVLAYTFAASSRGGRLSTIPWFAPAITAIILVFMALPRTDFFIVILFPVLIVTLISEANIIGKLLASPLAHFFGTISYSIYLVHFLLKWGARLAIESVLHRHGVAHPHNLATAITLGLTLPISYAAYRLIEAPGRRWMRAIFEPRTLGETPALISPSPTR